MPGRYYITVLFLVYNSVDPGSEIERGNLSIQSLNPASGHILTNIGRAEKICPILSLVCVCIMGLGVVCGNGIDLFL